MSEAQEVWEERYRQRVWSGRVNVRLAEIAETLTPGRALDLGCGEGADAIWLAERGWRVVAVDISPTALQRGAGDAKARGVAERIEFVHHDLSETFPAGEFDFVSAQFLHSTVPLDRPRLLRRAADAVADGGVLLIVGHSMAPPSVSQHAHHPLDFASAEEVVDALNLPVSEWNRLRVESVDRPGIGPDGKAATLTDTVVLLRRRRHVDDED